MSKTIYVQPPIIVKELAERIGISPYLLIHDLMYPKDTPLSLIKTQGIRIVDSLIAAPKLMLTYWSLIGVGASEMLAPNQPPKSGDE